MSYYRGRFRSKVELRAIAYRAFLYLIVPVIAILPACGSRHEYAGPCPDVSIAVRGPALIYPIPDATNVPTTASALIFSSLPVLPGVTTSLVPSSSSGGAATLQLGAFTVAPSPIPSPAASYEPSAKLYAVAYPALAPSTTYTIQYGTSQSGPCSSAETTSSGSFTTSYRFLSIGKA